MFVTLASLIPIMFDMYFPPAAVNLFAAVKFARLVSVCTIAVW